MGVELECDHCGGVAFESEDDYVTEDEGEACATCGWPGHVAVDGHDCDPDENFAYWRLDDDGKCNDPACDECNGKDSNGRSN